MSTELQDEPEIIRATKTMHGYLASPLSEHISEMPDGSLVVVGCPVARTGWQQYSVRDLPQERARELNIDTSNPSAMIDLYRPASEVFKPEFLASLNGRPVTDNHPPGFVDPSNFNLYSKGHIQNPRRGPEPLDDGEWPVIADLVISGEPLVGKVRTKQARDISLGYDFSIDRDGDRIIQCDYVANHTAVVPKGRAGDLVSIGDAEPEESPPIAPPAEQRAATSKTSTAVLTKKENKPVANILKHLIGLGFKAYAVDAEPEQLAEAAEAIKHAPPAEDKKKARDEEFEIEETGQVKDRRPRKARDLDPEIEETHTNDKRSKMHDALDKMLDAKGKDEDLNELGDMLKEFFGQEAKEPEHQVGDELEEEEVEDADPAELEELLGAGERPDAEDGAEECPECGLPGDECECEDAEEEVGPAGEENLEEEEKVLDRKRARDRATAHDGAAATLKMLRPVVARCNDAAVKRAFNTALGSLTRTSRVRGADSGYKAVLAGSRARTNVPTAPFRAQANDAAARAADANARTQAAYDKIRKGGK